MLVFFGSVALGLLITARCLEPSTDGFGTHRGLGLPACGFRAVYGKPCPSCGMTTSWSLLTRGRITESILANAGGFLLGVATMVSGAWMLGSGLRGKWLIGFPSFAVIVTSFGSIVAITTVNWLFRFLLSK